jgi:hypothetical protein
VKEQKLGAKRRGEAAFLDEKRLKLEDEVVDVRGLTHKNLSRHESFMKTQIKPQRKCAKQLVLVAELSSDTLLKSGMKTPVELRIPFLWESGGAYSLF